MAEPPGVRLPGHGEAQCHSIAQIPRRALLPAACCHTAQRGAAEQARREVSELRAGLAAAAEEAEACREAEESALEEARRARAQLAAERQLRASELAERGMCASY
jgi:hypothetical protein